MKKLLLVSCVFFSGIKAEVDAWTLKKHPNNVFICTGARSSVDLAIALYTKFAYVYGIEEDEILVKHSRFAIPAYIYDIEPTRYFVHHGDSRTLLPKLLNPIKEPVTILLNRYIPDRDNPEKKNYVLEELDVINNHSIKKHTILIDYIHLAGSNYFGNISLESIRNKILMINPNYRFKFEKGGNLGQEENAILVAYLD